MMMRIILVLKKYSLFIGGGIFVIAIFGVGIFSYSLGYTRGSGNLTAAPLSIINAQSIGSIALDDPGAKTDFSSFWKTWVLLDKNFVPSSNTVSATTSSETRVLGAIEGMVASYGDPYTVFIPKEKAESFKEQVNGEFEGIGAGLGFLDGALLVTGTLEGSPARKAGLEPGDRVIAVDGAPTTGGDLAAIVSKIRGAAGTSVSLTIAKQKSSKETVVAVTRGKIAIPTTATRVVTAAKSVIDSVVAKAGAAAAAVAGSVKDTLGIEQKKAAQAAKQEFFVLQLATFAKSSTDAFIKDLGKFAKSDTPYLIIDLRNNPGGYIETAVDLASYFLPKDALIVTEKTSASNTPGEYKSLGYGALSGIASSSRRIVVLVNRNSASASEILAGALQDHSIAKVVGEKSFGKGSVQTLVDIGDLGSLKITIARWYTPNGKNISHEGITPDITVDMADAKYASSTDPYMDAATETLLDDSLWQK
jgi:carboxyl-terminal processing protease